MPLRKREGKRSRLEALSQETCHKWPNDLMVRLRLVYFVLQNTMHIEGPAVSQAPFPLEPAPIVPLSLISPVCLKENRSIFPENKKFRYTEGAYAV